MGLSEATSTINKDSGLVAQSFEDVKEELKGLALQFRVRMGIRLDRPTPTVSRQMCALPSTNTSKRGHDSQTELRIKDDGAPPCQNGLAAGLGAENNGVAAHLIDSISLSRPCAPIHHEK